jgi:hypothetical protein
MHCVATFIGVQVPVRYRPTVHVVCALLPTFSKHSKRIHAQCLLPERVCKLIALDYRTRAITLRIHGTPAAVDELQFRQVYERASIEILRYGVVGLGLTPDAGVVGSNTTPR